MQLSSKCRACGTINISIYVNFLSTNPTFLRGGEGGRGEAGGRGDGEVGEEGVNSVGK